MSMSWSVMLPDIASFAARFRTCFLLLRAAHFHPGHAALVAILFALLLRSRRCCD